MSYKYCSFGKIQIKEDEKDYFVSGFVATSHPDRAESEGFAGDIIPKSTLQKIVSDINNKYLPQAGAVSERHDHLKGDPDAPIAGVISNPATLQQLEDGEWGVHVETVLSKTNPRYEEVKTNIEQGVYPGFSIEYLTKDFVPTEKEGKRFRMLTDINTEGFGYANRRKIANPHAEITNHGYKEIMSPNIKTKTNKVIEMEKDKKEVKEEEKKEEVPEEKKEEEKEEIKEVKEVIEKKEEKEFSDKDLGLLREYKEKEAKKAQFKEVTSSKEFKESVQAGIKEAMAAEAPVMSNAEGKPEFKELDSYKAALAEFKEMDKPMKNVDARQHFFKRSIDKQFKEAAKFTDALMANGVPVWKNWKERTPIPSPSNLREGVGYADSKMTDFGGRIEAKELSRVEMKAGEGLQTDTNKADSSWTYGSYFLSPVELNDIFQPVLVNQLNDQTTTFGRLQKENWNGRSQIQFRARTGRNSTVGGYSEGANLTYGSSFTGTVARQKFQQPFAYYRVLVAVTGQEMQLAKSPGGMGDVWADEIKWSGQDLLSASGTKGAAATGLNVALLGSGDGTSEDIALGFEGLILGTTGTLYGKDLAAANSLNGTLRSHKETLSTVNISLKQLRKMIRLVKTGTGTGGSQIHSNSRDADLVFFTHHIQVDFVKAIFQAMQRITPTSGRVGFEGELSIDEIPMVPDRQIETDDVFLINTANTKIAMNLPPTLEPLPVTADAQAAHIKTYWNVYSDAPGNNYWTEGFSVS